MWISNWFNSTLQFLGLKNKRHKVLVLGLDDVGKTSLLLRYKQDAIGQQPPTFNSYADTITIENCRIETWDLGGTYNRVWKQYIGNADRVIYMVDASNPQRFEQAKTQFQGVLLEPQLEKVPIAILGNKIDKVSAVFEEELRKALGLESKQVKSDQKQRPLKVFMCSVAKKVGYADAFKWLLKELK